MGSIQQSFFGWLRPKVMMVKHASTANTRLIETTEPEDIVSDQPRKRKSKSPSGLLSVAGTRLISPQAPDDLVFNSLRWRIEREKSVALWSYRRKENVVHVKVMFLDEDTTLDMKVDSLNIVELKIAIDKIEEYFLLKSQRS